LPQLQSENSTLPIDTDTASWISKYQQQLQITEVLCSHVMTLKIANF